MRVIQYGPSALQFTERKVFRIEAIVSHLAQRRDQLVDIARTRPYRRKPVLFVERRQRIAESGRGSTLNVCNTALLDLLADLFRYRAQRLLGGRRLCGVWLRNGLGHAGLLRLRDHSPHQTQNGYNMNDTRKFGRHGMILHRGVGSVIPQPTVDACACGGPA